MPPIRTSAEAVLHVLRLYAQGIICPTETWHSVVRSLSEPEAEAVLNGLPADAQQLVRDLSNGRAAADPDPEYAAVNAQVVLWCEQKSQ